MIDLSSLRAPLRALSAVLLLALSNGCSDLRNCPNDNPDPISMDTDKASRDLTAITYQSAPDNDLDEFKAKTKYRFVHELGVTPLFVKVYLSFDQFGTDTPKKDDDSAGAPAQDGPGSIAESAGNQALIDCKDAHVIEVRNDTCQDFFIYLVAADAVPTKPGAPPDTKKRCGE